MVRAPALVWMYWKIEGPRAIATGCRAIGAERFRIGRALRPELDAAKIIYLASTWVVPILIAIYLP